MTHVTITTVKIHVLRITGTNAASVKGSVASIQSASAQSARKWFVSVNVLRAISGETANMDIVPNAVWTRTASWNVTSVNKDYVDSNSPSATFANRASVTRLVFSDIIAELKRSRLASRFT